MPDQNDRKERVELHHRVILLMLEDLEGQFHSIDFPVMERICGICQRQRISLKVASVLERIIETRA